MGNISNRDLCRLFFNLSKYTQAYLQFWIEPIQLVFNCCIYMSHVVCCLYFYSPWRRRLNSSAEKCWAILKIKSIFYLETCSPFVCLFVSTPPSVPFSPFTSGKLYEVDLAERLTPAQDYKVNTMTGQVFEPKHNTLASAPHLMLVAFGPHIGGTFFLKKELFFQKINVVQHWAFFFWWYPSYL